MNELLPVKAVHHLKEVFGEEVRYDLEEASSAQQKVWILKNLQHHSYTNHTTKKNEYAKALIDGNSCLVLRIWKGAAAWWNLNDHQSSVLKMARAEVDGYCIAHQANLDGSMHMPVLLHFEPLQKDPFAIFSYVGPEATHLAEEKGEPDRFWIDTMVKTRPEFGFDEPHPRWGRVPVDDCMEYVVTVLEQFILPLHRYITENPSIHNDYSQRDNYEPYTYSSMVTRYQQTMTKLQSSIKHVIDPILKTFIETLGSCVSYLADKHRNQVMTETEASNLPLVLVHMDVQPQNLIHRSRGTIASVLDWEEAAWADRRFELLLMGRKVCANRSQADRIWKLYQEKMDLELGPIEPWLRLETVHSLATLLLQSVNLGGRSPWEKKQDLLGKIEREFRRLYYQLGVVVAKPALVVLGIEVSSG